METKVLDAVAATRDIEENGFVLLRDVVSKEQLGCPGRTHPRRVRAAARQSGELFAGGGSLSGHLNCFPGEGSTVRPRRSRPHTASSTSSTTSRLMEPAVSGPTATSTSRAASPSTTTSTGTTRRPSTCAPSPSSTLTSATAPSTCSQERTAGSTSSGSTPCGRKYRLSTRVPMKRGDVIIRKSTLWHRGMPNHSTAMRPQLTFTFGEGGAPTR